MSVRKPVSNVSLQGEETVSEEEGKGGGAGRRSQVWVKEEANISVKKGGKVGVASFTYS